MSDTETINTLSLEGDCKELINELRISLSELAALIERSKAHIRIDAIYKIPLRKTPRVDPNQEIEVTCPDRDESVDLAILALTDIDLAGGQSAKETLRVPGAIGVPALVLEQIHVTNQLRMQLFEKIQAAQPAMRKRIWKSSYPISGLQAMRVTPFLPDPKLIRFYWDTGSVTTRWVASDLMRLWEDQLIETFGHRPSHEEVVDHSVEMSLLSSLEKLETLKNHSEQVAIHRLGTPHIRARITDGTVLDTTTGLVKPYISLAAVPFVYDNDCAPPRISALTSYSPTDSKRKSGKDLLQKNEYVKGMHVYRYAKGHRYYGPFERRSSARNIRAPKPDETA
ncbi:TPA: hypothetical protein ACP32N_003218 [Pseudomonas aeruginosa]